MVGRGAWAVLDQGLFSVANFGLNVLLARWLSPHDYGGFAMAFSILLLLGALHTALISEPLLVFGLGKYRDRQTAYLRAVLRGHWKLSLWITALLLLVGGVVWWLRSPDIAVLILSLGVTTPLVLFQSLVRRACYTRVRPELAAFAGALYGTVQLSGLYLLREHEWLSPPSALLLLGMGSLASAVWPLKLLGLEPPNSPRGSLDLAVATEHWQYGRWALGVSVLMWIPGNAYYLALPLWSGVAATGALRALVTMVMPMIQTTGAIGVVVLQSLVQVRGRPGFAQLVQRMLWVFGAASVIYWIAIGMAGGPLLGWIYDGKYVDLGPVLWLMGLLPLLTGLIVVVGAALRALERPDQIFWAYLASSGMTLSLGLLLTARFGVLGAAIGITTSYAATAVALGWAYVGRVTRARDEISREGGRDP
jgi:O-antigen/teichoic acid export membrane protein